MGSWGRSACYPRSTFCLMSDGPSTRNHRITRARFRACSAYLPHSQAHLYPYALRAIAKRAEWTFALLRYLLGGDRPSQTTHLALSPARIHGTRLEFKHAKSGISPTAPGGLASPLHSLPPILHMTCLNPILSCSKGSRGLSVLRRVGRIFTTTSFSPSPSLRHCPSRYAIHAGRNLPDKEFRYLRTVIVTAAIHRRFSSELRPEGLTRPLNVPALGRRQSVYSVLRLSTDLCF